jgi:hypothetical protein
MANIRQRKANSLALKSVEEDDNYGIRLGKTRGLIVVDVDKFENEQFFIKQTRVEYKMYTRTPRGHHYYFLYDERFDGITRFRILYVDILEKTSTIVRCCN